MNCRFFSYIDFRGDESKHYLIDPLLDSCEPFLTSTNSTLTFIQYLEEGECSPPRIKEGKNLKLISSHSYLPYNSKKDSRHAEALNSIDLNLVNSNFICFLDADCIFKEDALTLFNALITIPDTIFGRIHQWWMEAYGLGEIEEEPFFFIPRIQPYFMLIPLEYYKAFPLDFSRVFERREDFILYGSTGFKNFNLVLKNYSFMHVSRKKLPIHHERGVFRTAFDKI